MNKYQGYHEALSYDKRPLANKQNVYVKGTSEYSTHKYVQKNTDFLLPQNFAEAFRQNTTMGVVPELNSVWMGLSKFVLWNYVNNTLTEVEFTSPVEHFITFKPRADVFTTKVSECALIINKDQIIIYGLSSDAREFVNTGLVTSVPDKVVCVTEHGGDIFVGCANGNVYKVVYQDVNMFSLRSMYLRNLDGSAFNFLFPAFFRFKKHLPVINVACSQHWLVALTKTEIRVYSVGGGREFKKKEMPLSTRYVSVEIVDDSEEDVFFYCVSRSGTRDFYNKSSYLLSRKAPFTDSELSDIKVCSNSESVVLSKDAYSGKMITVIHFNEDQKLNFSATKAVDNFEILNVEDVRDIFLHDQKIFVLTGKEIKVFSIMDPEDFLLHCRPEDTYTFLKAYGERETLVYYYSIVSKNKDYSKIEHIYNKNEASRIPAYYSFIHKLTAGLMDRAIDQDFFVESERVMRRIKTVSSKLRFKEDFVTDLVETLNFLKIYYEYGLTVNEKLEKLLLGDPLAKKTLLDNLLGQFGGKIDTIINLLLTKCPSFIPLNEIYYQKGLDALEKKDLQESLGSFKNLSYGLEPIVEKFNELKFYTGSVTLLRKMDLSFERRVSLLKQSIQCRGALNVALGDFREDFAFCVFEALLSNHHENYMREACACCGEGTGPFLKKDFLSMSSPFLLQFLVDKSELSLREEEYTLLWKYCVLNDMKDRAVESLVRIAENKHMRLDRRIEYLNIALSIKPSKELSIRLETAKIQCEMLMKKYIPVLDNMLLPANDLFNDYIIPNRCFALGLSLIDLYEYCDVALLKRLWTDALQGSLSENLAFIKGLKIKKSALNFGIIGGIVVTKLDQSSPNLIDFFLEYGFPKNDVMEFFEKMIKDPKISHPMQKKRMLDILLQSSEGNAEHVKRVAHYCQSNYGIK